ncbi:protein-disulfide reductase DsbD [Sphingosinicella sp. BN140058]|uniref:protein-disulfide reductase DsbD family protein n=1 Tax=Sphingosinicella sp. BN140058 TaxID=1892855 RepID=UPI0010111558|nr:protein-disulfide reductase DsbD domain-containing protein [Sphingosinicella sp. BN140058]QAY77673.1 thiol:disulfide interchange protein [Sphingosinicella sp. BN140058]
MTRLVLFFLLLLATLAWPAEAQMLAPGQRAVSTRLIAEHDAPVAGGRVTVALVMTPRPGWHGYWKNPGDAGVETRIAWQLPSGVVAGAVHYPVPQRLIVAGLMNYVYEGEHALLIDFTVPAGRAPGTVLPIRGKADYLVCTDEICVPESADLSLDLRVGRAAASNPIFDRWREALPKPLGSAAAFARDGNRLRIGIPLPAAIGVEDPYFFPLTDGALAYSAPQAVSRAGDMLIVDTKAGDLAPTALQGVLSLGGGQGLLVDGRPGTVPASGIPIEAAGPAAAPAGTRAILLALGGALLGGLLLNVMPCVFPILSLKALSLARAGGEERAVRREAVAYALGVIGICVGLGAVLLGLRAGGTAIGWAFQLQDPRVILLLLLLVLAIALNLAGLFELPSVSAGSGLADRGGVAGAFWTGALAAFVATPCTGPFMGAALGAALVLPHAAALAIFAGLGLGLALPFLLLGFVPALRRRLPRPGPWMGRMRRILSVPMFLTALGLAWILERQTGTHGVLIGVAAASITAALLWWAGRRRRWAALAPALLSVLAAIILLPEAANPVEARGGGLLRAEPFSEARLAALRAEGRPVFVYFTADWCVTCKVNEQAVLNRQEVADALVRGKVAVLVGDWTRGDAEIGRFLEKNGRSGVPLYLHYAPGKAPQALPQILTVGTVTRLVA